MWSIIVSSIATHLRITLKTLSLMVFLLALPSLALAQQTGPVGLADPDAGQPKVESFKNRMEIRFEGPANWFWYDAMLGDYHTNLDLSAGFPVLDQLWLGVSVGVDVVGGDSVLVGVPVKAFAKGTIPISMGAQSFVELSGGVSLGSTRLNADYLFSAGLTAGVELALSNNMSVSMGPRIEYISDLKEQSLPIGGIVRFSTYL